MINVKAKTNFKSNTMIQNLNFVILRAITNLIILLQKFKLKVLPKMTFILKYPRPKI